MLVEDGGKIDGSTAVACPSAVRLIEKWSCGGQGNGGLVVRPPITGGILTGPPLPTPSLRSARLCTASLRRRGCGQPVRPARQPTRTALLGRAPVERTCPRGAVHHRVPADGRRRPRGPAGGGSCLRRGFHRLVRPESVESGGPGARRWGTATRLPRGAAALRRRRHTSCWGGRSTRLTSTVSRPRPTRATGHPLESWEKLGFVREGRLREDCVVNGDVSDSWVYGLLKQELPDIPPSRSPDRRPPRHPVLSPPVVSGRRLAPQPQEHSRSLCHRLLMWRWRNGWPAQRPTAVSPRRVARAQG